jgi:uncharacterized damage-inducible protein DinB
MPGSVPPVADEREALCGYLAQQRYVVRLTAYGLTDEQAREAPTASSLCVGGIVKHLAAVERSWTGTILGRDEAPRDNRYEAYQTGFDVRTDETLRGLLDDYEAAGLETDRVVDSIPDLAHPVPVPKSAPWFPKDVDAWSLRWVLMHLIQETARHAGHADIIRESVDGATAYPLMAAAENWPAAPWIEPWRPRP